MTTPSVLNAVSLFSAVDRCDRCSANASLLVMLHSGGQLLFCGHHARAHRSMLQHVGDLFQDGPVLVEVTAA